MLMEHLTILHHAFIKAKKVGNIEKMNHLQGKAYNLLEMYLGADKFCDWDSSKEYSFYVSKFR